MEDLNKILDLSKTLPVELEKITEDCLLKLRSILWGQIAAGAVNRENLKDVTTASPQQTKKRIKRLSALNEDKEPEVEIENIKKSPGKRSPAPSDIVDDVNKAIENETNIPGLKSNSESTFTNMSEKPGIVQQENVRKSEATNLMPPPPVPLVACADETFSKRPQRAAKLKSEKNLKEPSLNTKLRRPKDEVKIKLEHEQRPSQMLEFTTSKPLVPVLSNGVDFEKNSVVSQKLDDSVVVITGKQPSIISITSDVEDLSSAAVNNKEITNEETKGVDSTDDGIREVRIRIKREKISVGNKDELLKSTENKGVFKAPESVPQPIILAKTEVTTMEESSLASSTLSSTANATTAPTKKARKKKDVVHKPIKVERFSDLDVKPSPISSRTRHGSLNKTANETVQTKEPERPASIYEDAVAATPSSNSSGTVNAASTRAIANETVNIGPSVDCTMNLGTVPGDATFCTNAAQTTFHVGPAHTTFVMDSNPNATVTIQNSGDGAAADTTFDVHQEPKTSKTKDDNVGGQRSFETAKDSSIPNNDSIMTEDEEEKPIETKQKTAAAPQKGKGASTKPTNYSAKASYKMPTRSHELFNPLAQSPVKMRVEAFENAAAAANEQSKRPLRSRKENTIPTSATTPVIGKLPAPALGRFLTPTQSSNITAINSVLVKKGTTSASKALPLLKSANSSSVYRTISAASSKTLMRENSADDFRKGLHTLAEERKKQREQKHFLAAQQREAKERERAERMAKLAKEREEKRLLKKQQQEQEQKKRELEEIQRKLRQQQEEQAAKLKAAAEREMLLHLKQQQQQQQLQLAKKKMMPPPPKVAAKYTFEMLHEDDSTDDEDKVSYKRPPPPSWSRSHVRGPIMLKQEYTPPAYIDSFFSVQPMTPDLKMIFPNIDARHLKRNSSVLWSTPPRYSELPKY